MTPATRQVLRFRLPVISILILTRIYPVRSRVISFFFLINNFNSHVKSSVRSSASMAVPSSESSSPLSVFLIPPASSGSLLSDQSSCSTTATAFDFSHLKQHGYQVFRGVVPRLLCEQLFAKASVLQREFLFRDPTTQSLTLVGPHVTHEINKTSGQIPEMHRIRQTPALVEIARQFFSLDPRFAAEMSRAENLRSSYDAFCYSLRETKPDSTGANRTKQKKPVAALASNATNSWAHYDQGLAEIPYDSIQMQVICSDNILGQADGGLVVWPKSHLVHQSVVQSLGLSSEDAQKNWIKFSAKHMKSIESRYGLCRLNVAAKNNLKIGDVIVWYSKTLHMYDAPLSTASTDRCVSYVTYCPKSCLTIEDIKKRRLAIHNGLTTSHWPGGDMVRINPKVPNMYKTEHYTFFKAVRERQHADWLEEIKQFQPTALGRAVLGWDDTPASMVTPKVPQNQNAIATHNPQSSSVSAVPLPADVLEAMPRRKRKQATVSDFFSAVQQTPSSRKSTTNATEEELPSSSFSHPSSTNPESNKRRKICGSPVSQQGIAILLSAAAALEHDSDTAIPHDGTLQAGSNHNNSVYSMTDQHPALMSSSAGIFQPLLRDQFHGTPVAWNKPPTQPHMIMSLSSDGYFLPSATMITLPEPNVTTNTAVSATTSQY